MIGGFVRKGPKPRPIVERFWEKVDTSGECWEWVGPLTRGGYGALSVAENGVRRNKRAHRLSWELEHGPIPDGLYVCHRCDNRLCVRPAHLFLGTAQDNVSDMIAKGRNHVAGLSPTCGRGHSDWATRPGGQRYCRTCNHNKGVRKGRSPERCKYGHNEWKTVSTTGARYCAICHQKRSRELNAKRKEKRRAAKLG